MVTNILLWFISFHIFTKKIFWSFLTLCGLFLSLCSIAERVFVFQHLKLPNNKTNFFSFSLNEFSQLLKTHLHPFIGVKLLFSNGKDDFWWAENGFVEQKKKKKKKILQKLFFCWRVKIYCVR